uniref:Agenet domain-containing protein n=1 Tax=Aegilops tauschii subsp. strangulata TaxID=200361 RepID=A0A452XPT9_AEGTS
MRGDRSAMRVTRGMHLEAKMGENAWRAGEVVWGNGHSYVLRWFDGGPDSERIRRTDVRPLPDPAVKLPADLATGDEVEVFHRNLWKRAVVVGAAGHGQFDVKIARSTEVLTADTSVLRPLMAYRGGEKGWVLIHKVTPSPSPSSFPHVCRFFLLLTASCPVSQPSSSLQDNEIPAESAVPWRPVAGKNIKSKANDNGGGKFAAHSTNLGLGKTKRSNYAVDADIVRDVKRFQGNNVFLAKREPAARYHDNNIEVMDVHPSHYLKKREQETSNHTKPNDEEIDVIGGGTDSDNDDDSNSS